MRPLLFAAFCALTLAACDSGSKYVPYVPGPGFKQVLQVSLQLVTTNLDTITLGDTGTVQAGQWVKMHATRKSGPWVLRDSTMKGKPACAKIAPIVEEYEVSGKINWNVEPQGQVTFTSPGPPNFDRQIKFNRPGRYRISASSSGCGAPFQSNFLEIVAR